MLYETTTMLSSGGGGANGRWPNLEKKDGMDSGFGKDPVDVEALL
jgi:hypothetical protein